MDLFMSFIERFAVIRLRIDVEHVKRQFYCLVCRKLDNRKCEISVVIGIIPDISLKSRSHDLIADTDRRSFPYCAFAYYDLLIILRKSSFNDLDVHPLHCIR